MQRFSSIFSQLLQLLPRMEFEQAVKKHHRGHADEVLEELAAKSLTVQALRNELERIKGNWAEIWSTLKPTLRPASEIRAILNAARAPTTVQQLGLTPEHLQRAFLAAREIRNRYTVLDLTAELGLLEKLRDEVLKASKCLG